MCVGWNHPKVLAEHGPWKHPRHKFYSTTAGFISLCHALQNETDLHILKPRKNNNNNKRFNKTKKYTNLCKNARRALKSSCLGDTSIKAFI